MDIINDAGTDETYGTYVDDECFGIHDYDDDIDHDTDDDTGDDSDDDTNDDIDDDNLYTIKVPGCCSWVPGPCGPWSLVVGPWSLLLCGLAQ